ncbi:TPA: hypothetical protein MI906_25015 [Klebsiella pneumoniae]|uniref:hypothetical protein n=1 Tax=Klebsiella pneumoniae TaxID=573 RepID=UPI0009038BB7|nr:hypothetical protein [Klebsiella quasipneumoniae]PCE37008.1 hypothetical protein CI706_14735 [Klebsiella pneumoniae subsp. pneumoniae]TMY16919.1 hypothetical protein EMG95_25320 [Klebsiella pneumoniae]ROF15439.1 hypothetical protein C4Y81_005825 [Klebsiella pneumoniae subsp. pneumoniae]ROG00035.1 hypothetical protein C4Y64_024705 [Klebsiella pneumoniae subsp. pneumoniae]
MPSKLKRRRWGRMRDDLAWYKDEAKDLHCRLMELADEVANLRKQILPESKTVIAKLKMYETDKDDRDHQLCRRCNDGIRGGCSSCAYNVR